MLEDAEKVVDAFDAFSQAAERERLQKDALKINYSGATFEADIIAGASAVAAAADDPIPINVFGCNVGKSWRKLQAGKIDLILTYPQCVPDTPGISVEDVYHARSRVAVQRSSPLAQRMRVSLSDLAGETFLVFQRQLAPLGYDFTMHVVQNAIGPCPIKVVPSIDYAVILEKLAVEGGVTIVPDWYENPLPRHIAFIDIVEDDADLTSAFVWRADANKPEIERFVEYARQYARKNHENGRQKHTG